MSEIEIVVCPKCNNARDSEAWNESTLNSFGAPLTPVIDAHSNECSYICPSCNTEVDGVSLQTYGWQQGEIEHWKEEAILQARLYAEWNNQLQQLHEELEQVKEQLATQNGHIMTLSLELAEKIRYWNLS